jgi:hypothetical protein
MDHLLYGLARVERQASSFPSKFKGYRASHCADVTDVPVGHIVFCLPLVEGDVNWRAVVLNVVIGNHECARLAWMHPACLRPLQPIDIQPSARVDLTEGRGSRLPSIDIGPTAVGVRQVRGALVLDARWDFPLGRTTHECTGHCYCLCHSVITNERCFADILRFAAVLQNARMGHVCCAHAKHRSVAAANVLRLCFGIPVDLEQASGDRCGRCCQKRAADHVPQLLRALRTVPALEVTADKSLAPILQLPE